MIERWPAIAAIALALTALVIADEQPRTTVAVVEAVPPELMPVATSSDSLGSTWYCPAGLATVDGSLDHVLIITNPRDETAIGQLTVYPAVPDGFGASTQVDTIVQRLEIAANAQVRISLGAILPDEPLFANAVENYIAALLEVDQPGLVVEHALVSPIGTDVGPCASTPAQTWHFASGTTKGDIRDLVAILNPFPGNASVDIRFRTDGEVRRPTAYTGLVLPPESVTLLDVRTLVPARPQMAMTVEARSGQVIVERIQLFAEPDGLQAATLTLGAPTPALQWFFPSGRAQDDYAESYVMYNPNDTAADVELEVQFDDPDEPTLVQPLTIAPGQRVVVVLDDSEFHPVSEVSTIRLGTDMPAAGSYWVVARSFNEVGIVAERLTTDATAPATGATAVTGVPLSGKLLYVGLPINEIPGAIPELVLLNPAGDTIANVTVNALVAGERQTILKVEVGPRRRAALILDELPQGTVALEIVASQGVMGELSLQGDASAVSLMATPVINEAQIPRLFAF